MQPPHPPPPFSNGTMPPPPPDILAHLQLIPEKGLEILLWIGAPVAVGFTIMRATIRWRSLGHLLEDDFAVLVATFLFLAFCITFQVSVPYMYAYGGVDGKMRSQAEQDALTIVWRKYQFATIILFWSILWSVKTSFLLFFRRLLIGTITQRMLWWNLVATFTAVTYVISVAMLFGSCRHFNDYFSTQTCTSVAGADMNAVVLWFSTMADVTSDVMIMVLPWQLLWGLRVTPRQKVALATIFSLSVVIVAFSILRLTHTNPANFAFGAVSLSLWALLEAFVAIVVVCLPSLKFLTSAHYSTTSRSKRGYATFNSSAQAGGGRRATIGHSRGLGSRASIYSGRRKSNHSESERPLSPEGILVTQQFEITKSDGRPYETSNSPRHPEEVLLKDMSGRKVGDFP